MTNKENASEAVAWQVRRNSVQGGWSEWQSVTKEQFDAVNTAIAAGACSETRALYTTPPSTQIQQEADDEAREPFAWFVWADNNGPVPLELFGWDEKACKHAVLNHARSTGWKGTVEGFLFHNGWTLRPAYTQSAHPAADALGAVRELCQSWAAAADLLDYHSLEADSVGAREAANANERKAAVLRQCRDALESALAQAPASYHDDPTSREAAARELPALGWKWEGNRWKAPAVRVTDEMVERAFSWPDMPENLARVLTRRHVRHLMEAALGQGKANGWA